MSTTSAPQTSARVSIPREFLRPSGWRNAEMIARAIGLWWGSSLIALRLVRGDLASPPVGLLLALPLFVVAGQGMHLLAFVGHDGSHGSLHRNRIVSQLIAICATSLLAIHYEVGFAISHAEHHRWVNTERDPDAVGMGRFRAYLARTTLPRSAAAR